jgi:hypothetical protein
MAANLTDFFREKKAQSDVDTAGIDWNAQRVEWTDAIESLYALIERWLAEPIKYGSVAVERRPKTISEPYLETYLVYDLILKVGDERVTFSPARRRVVGAQGRLDITGESGEAALVLQLGSRWSVVISKVPQLRLVNFGEQEFAEVLQAVMRK